MGNKKKKDLCKIKEKTELEIMPLFGVYIYALLQLSVACLLNHFVISSFLLIKFYTNLNISTLKNNLISYM